MYSQDVNPEETQPAPLLVDDCSLLSRALEVPEIGVIIADRNGTIQWCNQAFSEITGYSSEEAVGMNVSILRSGQHPQEFYDNLWATILKGSSWRGELINRRKDGSLYFEEQSITPMLDPDGGISHFIAIKQDITSRKRTQAKAEALALAAAALSASLDFNQVLDRILEQVQNTIPDSAVFVSLIQDDRLVIQRQRGFEEHPETLNTLSSGYRIDQIPEIANGIQHQKPILYTNGIPYSSTPHWPGLEWAHSFASAPLVLSNKVLGFIHVINLKNIPFTAEIFGFLLPFADHASAALYNAKLYLDLQESLRKEQASRDKLIEVEKFAAIGRMVASVTHEINNPLQTIENCLYLTRTKIPAGDPVHLYLDMAASETQRLTDLAAQLREIYRPADPSLKKTINLGTVLDEVCELLYPQLASNKVRWIKDMPDEPVRVYGNPDQLKQLFINLAVNAIQAMGPSGGRIEVSSSRSADGRMVAIALHDTGPGIPQDIDSRIFEPFYTTKEHGLGLGLAICHGIIQRHKGQITAENHPQGGAVFTVSLPLAEGG